MTANLPFRRILLSLLACVVLFPGPSMSQTGRAPLLQEYFIRQSVDEDLFIRINGYEAEFSSNIKSQDGRQLLHSGISGSRLVPVFQYVDAPDKNRQLDIRVESYHFTGRTEFGLELTRLKVWDDRSRSISRAYRLLSIGMQTEKAGGDANWTVKIDSLINAARLFQQFGMIEMRLWANYLTAHLIHHQLNDYSMAYTLTSELLGGLKNTRLQTLELATLQLQSAALIGLKRAGEISSTSSEGDPVQTALSRLSSLAGSQGYLLEQTLALQASGEEYAADALYTEALAQFRQAVSISDRIDDAELSTEIRESMVRIHAIEGDTRSSTRELQKIETQLESDGDKDELALNLLAQGRILIRNFQYEQATDNLLRALQHQNNSAVRQQINFELARAYFESGRLDEAESYLKLIGITAQAPRQRRSGSVIDRGEAYAILADIHRINKEFDLMRAARQAQGDFHSGQGRYQYFKGKDALAAGGASRDAVRFFSAAAELARQEGDGDLQGLSQLQMCLLDAGQFSFCAESGLRSLFQGLTLTGIPRTATEAMYLRAGILLARGKPADAINIMDRLIDEIQMLQSWLPGVLGGWYQEHHEEVSEFYLGLLSQMPGSNGSKAFGLSSLLVLSKIRAIETAIGIPASGDNAVAQADRLRMRLAQLADTAVADRSAALRDPVNQTLAEMRLQLKTHPDSLSVDKIRAALGALKRNEVVLTYHISPGTAQVWVAGRSGVTRRDIPAPAKVFTDTGNAGREIGALGLAAFDRRMSELGKTLIDPVKDLLKERIYWIPSGALLGFPLDALRLNNRYLVQDHTIVSLLAYPTRMGFDSQKIKSGQPSMFLAGYPVDYSGEYASRLQTSAEIESVADLFVGPGLTIVQGTALLPDEFSGGKFTESQLIHLATPGVIDLRYPQLSKLELSGFEGGEGRATLYPYDIRSQRLTADLVFLSSTQLVQEPASAFVNRLGLINELTEAGAGSVLARLWRSPGGTPESLMLEFYQRLEETGNAADALATSKRSYIKKQRTNGLNDWAGFQLFIR